MSAASGGDPAPGGDATGDRNAGDLGARREGDLGARRGLAVAVVVCAAGAGLALLAASRNWGEVTITRPAPLPPVVEARSADAWLSALGFVCLAGAGALLATRGVVRQAVGALLVAVGLGITAGAAMAITEGDGPWWPALCAMAGVAVAGAGGLTVRRGRSWPAMGTRYERSPAGSAPGPRAGGSPDGVTPSGIALWDALDRGEDPTR